METTLLIPPRYTNEELEQDLNYLLITETEILETQARQHAREHQPEVFKHYLVDILAPLKAKIQRLYEKNHSIHQPVTVTVITNTVRDQVSEEVRNLNIQEKHAEVKTAKLQGELEALQLSTGKILVYHLKRLTPVIIAGCETILMFTLLQGVSMPLWMNIFLSVVIGILTGIGIKAATSYLKKALVPKQQRRRYALVIALAFGAAIALGTWRASINADVVTIKERIQMITPHAAPSLLLSSIPFIVISFLLFVLGVSVQLHLILSAKQVANIRRHQALQQQIEELKTERRHLINKQKQLRIQSHALGADSLQKLEYATAYERRLLAAAHELKQVYEAVNLSNRPGTECPPFFGVPYDWQFITHFHHQKNN